jgi:hypothetical protein
MDRSDSYRRYARECLELARIVQHERSRAILLQMAHVWNDLADKHEHAPESNKVTYRA